MVAFVLKMFEVSFFLYCLPKYMLEILGRQSFSSPLLPIIFQFFKSSWVVFGIPQFILAYLRTYATDFQLSHSAGSLFSSSCSTTEMLSRFEDLFFVVFPELKKPSNYQQHRTHYSGRNFNLPNEFPGPLHCHTISRVHLPVD